MATEQNANTANFQSALDLPGKSARLVAKYWKLFALVNLPFILLAIPAALGNDSPGKDGADNGLDLLNAGEIAATVGAVVLFMAIFILIAAFFYAMNIRLSLEVAKTGKAPTVTSLVDTAKKYWLKVVLLSLLSAVIIVAGFILLIIPGIIAAILLIFAPMILVDKNCSVTEAIRGSINLVKANLGTVLSALLVYLGLMILSSIIMEITFIGAIAGTVISILFSLILFLRYQELRNSVVVKAVK